MDTDGLALGHWRHRFATRGLHPLGGRHEAQSTSERSTVIGAALVLMAGGAIAYAAIPSTPTALSRACYDSAAT